MIAVLSRSSGGRSVDDIGAKCGCNRSYTASDVAKTSDSPGFTFYLAKTLVEVSEYGVLRIGSIFYIVIIVTELFQQIEEHGKCMLRHRFGRIVCYIAPCDTVAVQIILVQIVGSCCSQADQLQVLSCTYGGFVDRDLAEHGYICISNQFRCLFGSCDWVFNDFSKSIKSGEINVISNTLCF